MQFNYPKIINSINNYEKPINVQVKNAKTLGRYITHTIDTSNHKSISIRLPKCNFIHNMKLFISLPPLISGKYRKHVYDELIKNIMIYKNGTKFISLSGTENNNLQKINDKYINPYEDLESIQRTDLSNSGFNLVYNLMFSCMNDNHFLHTNLKYNSFDICLDLNVPELKYVITHFNHIITYDTYQIEQNSHFYPVHIDVFNKKSGFTNIIKIIPLDNNDNVISTTDIKTFKLYINNDLIENYDYKDEDYDYKDEDYDYKDEDNLELKTKIFRKRKYFEIRFNEYIDFEKINDLKIILNDNEKHCYHYTYTTQILTTIEKNIIQSPFNCSNYKELENKL
jgi:hypothetical protein